MCCLYVMKHTLFFFFLLKSLDTLRVPTDACCVSLATEKKKKKGKPERRKNEWKFEAQINTNLLSPWMTLSACSMWHSTRSSTCNAYQCINHRTQAYFSRRLHSQFRSDLKTFISHWRETQVFMSVRYKMRIRGKEKYFTASVHVQWWPICWEESWILYTEYIRHTMYNWEKPNQAQSSTKVSIKVNQSKTSRHWSDQWFFVVFIILAWYCQTLLLFLIFLPSVYLQCTKRVNCASVSFLVFDCVTSFTQTEERHTHPLWVVCLKGLILYVSSAWFTGEGLVGLASYFQQDVEQTPQLSLVREWCWSSFVILLKSLLLTEGVWKKCANQVDTPMLECAHSRPEIAWDKMNRVTALCACRIFLSFHFCPSLKLIFTPVISQHPCPQWRVHLLPFAHPSTGL